MSGDYLTYFSENEDETNCILRYNQVSTNYGRVLQKNSGRSKYNVEINQIVCTNRSTSALQINDEKSIGNLQINFGVIGKQINLSENSDNIQINYVDDCTTDYTVSEILTENDENRYIICRNFGRDTLKFSRESTLLTYDISIIQCNNLSKSTKKIHGKNIIYTICVDSNF